MLEYLPDIYKEAIILTEFLNYSQKELAVQLGLSVSGAKSRVQRGREKLKKLLTDCCSFETDTRGNIIDYKKRDKCDSCYKC
jgi:RNA polymerase sigma-70 factor (ECF subfamily)